MKITIAENLETVERERERERERELLFIQHGKYQTIYIQEIQ